MKATETLPESRTSNTESTGPAELVVISGKGGTGKTSIVASFAALAGNAVLTDCDVDAADLHLVLGPEIRRRESFSGGSVARMDPELCNGCGSCARLCRFGAIIQEPSGEKYRIDPIACEGCGVCEHFCPQGAVIMEAAENGEWFVSETRHGTMVHARLGVAEENSGKLVSLLRKQARGIAREEGSGLVIIDGTPGIGCPVIASITGADLVVVVTEPSLSGLHDLDRVLSLASHFRIPALACINKRDLNDDVAARIGKLCARRNVPVAGGVDYDPVFTAAMIAGTSVVEHGDSRAGEQIRALWGRVRDRLERRAK